MGHRNAPCAAWTGAAAPSRGARRNRSSLRARRNNQQKRMRFSHIRTEVGVVNRMRHTKGREVTTTEHDDAWTAQPAQPAQSKQKKKNHPGSDNTDATLEPQGCALDCMQTKKARMVGTYRRRAWATARTATPPKSVSKKTEEGKPAEANRQSARWKQ